MSYFDDCEEEKEKFINNCVEELVNQTREDEKFFLEKQDNIMELVYQYLINKENFIDNEDILYNPQKYDFIEKDFNNLCYNIITYAHNIITATYVENIPFKNKNCCLTYKNLNIIVRNVYGQGTMYQMRTDMQENWNEIASFNYGDYKEFMLNLNYREEDLL